MTTLTDPRFLLGVLSGAALTLLVLGTARRWILHHLHESIAARELRGIEQARRAQVHCEPGPPAA